jgi:hypothetical protein
VSNGKDHPGEYQVLVYTATTAAALKAFLENEEKSGFLLAGLNQDFIVLYKKDKH